MNYLNRKNEWNSQPEIIRKMITSKWIESYIEKVLNKDNGSYFHLLQRQVDLIYQTENPLLDGSLINNFIIKEKFGKIDNFDLNDKLFCLLNTVEVKRKDLFKIRDYLDKTLLFLKGFRDKYNEEIEIIINIISIIRDRISALTIINDVYSTTPIIRSIFELVIKFNNIYIQPENRIEKYKLWQISSLNYRQAMTVSSDASVKVKDAENDMIDILKDDFKNSSLYNNIYTNLSNKQQNLTQEQINNKIFDKVNMNIDENGNPSDFVKMMKDAGFSSFFNDKYNQFSQFSHPTYDPIFNYREYKEGGLNVAFTNAVIYITAKFLEDVSKLFPDKIFFFLKERFIKHEISASKFNSDKEFLINKEITDYEKKKISILKKLNGFIEGKTPPNVFDETKEKLANVEESIEKLKQDKINL